MAYFAPDPYNQPEAFGLEIISTIDDPRCYEFNLLVVWRHIETGKLYWATDSGCSCPLPFEDYSQLSDLDEIVPGNRRELEQAAREFVDRCEKHYREQARYEVTLMLARVSDALWHQRPRF